MPAWPGCWRESGRLLSRRAASGRDAGATEGLEDTLPTPCDPALPPFESPAGAQVRVWFAGEMKKTLSVKGKKDAYNVDQEVRADQWRLPF